MFFFQHSFILSPRSFDTAQPCYYSQPTALFMIYILFPNLSHFLQSCMLFIFFVVLTPLLYCSHSRPVLRRGPLFLLSVAHCLVAAIYVLIHPYPTFLRTCQARRREKRRGHVEDIHSVHRLRRRTGRSNEINGFCIIFSDASHVVDMSVEFSSRSINEAGCSTSMYLLLVVFKCFKAVCNPRFILAKFNNKYRTPDTNA